jgi:hypothetical protein
MANVIKHITKLELKSLGLNDYLIREIVKGLNADNTNGFNLYFVSDIANSIKEKLAKPKTKETTRKKLQNVLEYLDGKSNVIEVDFLKQLTPENKVAFLTAKLEQLDAKEKVLIQETNDILRQAKRMLVAK